MKAFVLIGQSTKFWQLVCSGAILSCPDLSSVVDLSSGDDWPTAHSQHSALVQCSWLRALWWVSCSDKYNHDHPVAPLLQPFGTWRSPHNNSALTGLTKPRVEGVSDVKGFFLWTQRTSGWA